MGIVDRLTRAVLRSAWLWGALVSVAFYGLLLWGEAALPPIVVRYLAGHWASYAAMSLFFVALAGLAIRAVELAREGWRVDETLLSPGNEQSTAAATAQLRALESLAAGNNSRVRRRFRDALRSFVRGGGGEGIDDVLDRLATADTAAASSGYSLVRLMTWAIPALGSLGTVVGIAEAVGKLAADTADPLAGVTDALALAFDTTALALGLSIALVGLRFLCEEYESRLLARIDQRARTELVGRYSAAVAPRGNPTEQFRHLTEALTQATDQLAKRAAAPVSAAEARNSGDLEAVVAAAVAKTLAAHQVGASSNLPAGVPTGWAEIQQALQANAAFMAQQQSEMAQQSQVIARLTEMLDKGSKNWPARKRLRADQDKQESSSLAGLWNAMNE